MTSLHLAVAFDSAGFHPAAWRDLSARPTELFAPAYWTDLGRTAERGLLDFVTIEDSFGLQSSVFGRTEDRTDQVRGRLDALQIAAFIAPNTTHLGIVPTVNVTLSEPFHVASATATLDYVSSGRAGWRPQVSARPSDAALLGWRTLPAIDPAAAAQVPPNDVIAEIFREATDAVEVVRRLWDSWEDDAVIRDEATGRYIDRDKLHYIDFEGDFFSVKGPSIVPRPPQGQPVIAALAHSQIVIEFAARSADVVFVTPADRAEVGRWVDDVRIAERTVDRSGAPLKVLADVNVVIDSSTAAADERRQVLDSLAGDAWRSDAAILTGTADDVADELAAWHDAGLDGFRLRPAVIERDLIAVVDELVPALQRRGRFRTEYGGGLFRERLGLDRPVSRFAEAGTR